MTARDTTPVGIAAWVALGIAVLFVVVGASIAGSYALSIHELDTQKAQAMTAQIRGAVPTCEALIRMDQASVGATNASSSPDSYGHRLARAIHDLTEETRCYALVRMVRDHVPYTVILRRLGGS